MGFEDFSGIFFLLLKENIYCGLYKNRLDRNPNEGSQYMFLLRTLEMITQIAL